MHIDFESVSERDWYRHREHLIERKQLFLFAEFTKRRWSTQACKVGDLKAPQILNTLASCMMLCHIIIHHSITLCHTCYLQAMWADYLAKCNLERSLLGVLLLLSISFSPLLAFRTLPN